MAGGAEVRRNFDATCSPIQRPGTGQSSVFTTTLNAIPEREVSFDIA
jgi:hypothetical protein